MNKTEYETPITNLRRLLQKDESSKFYFVIRTNKFKKEKQASLERTKENIQIETTINKARVLSKKIDHIYQVDPTISTYYLDIPSQENDDDKQHNNISDMIELILKSTEEKINIPEDEERKKIFHIIQYLLGEEESNINEENNFIKNIDESISYLSTDFHQLSIEYLSRHIKEILENEQIKKLEYTIIYEIIDTYFKYNKESKDKDKNSDKIKKDNEYIFNKMIEISEDENIILYFIINIEAEEMNEEMIKFLYSNLNDEIIANELSLIIHIIRTHLNIIYKNSNESNNNNVNNAIKVEYTNDELNGIITYLKGNEAAEEFIKNKIHLKGGGEIYSSYPIANLIKYDSNNINNHYYNKNSKFPTEKDSWIIFDFGERKINLSSYTIRSNGGSINGHAHPKTWKILGSNDNEQWETINEQTNNPILNGPNKQHRFECQQTSKYYRYIQYKQEDSWDDDKRYQYVVYLTCIEFFGSISNPK